MVAGNWKMHLDRHRAVELANSVHAEVGSHDVGVDVGVFPAFVHLDLVHGALHAGLSRIFVGGQDGYMGAEGAFTGEVSMAMLKDVGATAVLVGHSERRHVIKESEALLREKTIGGLDAGLTVVLCVGETLEQRERGETDRVNESQIRSALAGLDVGRMRDRMVIAYEPVWAIGTGKTATPKDAQDAHARIRSVLGSMFGSGFAEATRILYGGSVKPENAAELFACPDIDGGLIGGAALKAAGFAAIVRAAAGTR